MKRNLLIALTMSIFLGFAATVEANHLSGGFVSFGANSFVVADAHHHHHTFAHHSGVAWVNDTGAAIDYHTVQPGWPLDVHYSGWGPFRRVNRVVVHHHGGHGHHH